MKPAPQEKSHIHPETAQPALSDLLAQRDELAQKIAQLEDALDGHQLSDDILQACEQLVNQHGDSGQSDGAILLAYGQQALPAEYYATLQDLLYLNQQEEAINSKLDARAGKQLSDYVQQQAQQLLDAFDVKQFSDGSYSEDDEAVILAAINDLETVVVRYSDSYAWGELAYDTVEKNRLLLEDYNLLSSTAEPVSPPYDSAELQRAHTLNNRYRPYHNELYPYTAQDKPLLPTHHWQVTLTPEQREAWTHHLQSIDAEAELNRLSIEGLDRLPFTYTQQQLRAYLAQIPGIAFEGVDTLVFKYADDELDDSVATALGEAWTTLAHHHHDQLENRAHIIVWLDPIVKQFQAALEAAEPSSEQAASVAATETMQATIMHEFGHALHSTLPVSLLHDWDEAARGATTDQPVSAYVAVMNHIGHEHYMKEDFADSFMLYMTSPIKLFSIAPERCAAMHRLVTSCQ